MNATATDPSRARPQPHIGKWVRSTCPGACRKRGDRKRPQATKKMIQESCTQPAGWGRGQSQAKSPQGCAYGLLPRPARGSEATGRRQAPASFVQAFCLSTFVGAWESPEGGRQEPAECQEAPRILSSPSPSWARVASATEGLWGALPAQRACVYHLMDSGPPAPEWRDSHEVLSLREGTAGVSLVRWSPAVSVCVCVSVCVPLSAAPHP